MSPMAAGASLAVSIESKTIHQRFSMLQEVTGNKMDIMSFLMYCFNLGQFVELIGLDQCDCPAQCQKPTHM